MKNTAFILVLALSLAACSTKKNGFEINGTFSNTQGEMIYLKAMQMNSLKEIDSVIPDGSGKFHFKEKLDFPNLFLLQKDDQNYASLIINPGEKVTITGDATNLMNDYEVSGSPDSKLLQAYMARLNKAFYQMGELQKIYQDSIKSPNLNAIILDLNRKSSNIAKDIREYTISFIQQNPGSLASLMALYQQLAPRQYVLDPVTDYSYYAMVDSILFAKYPESEPVKTLHLHLVDLKQRQEVEALRNRTLGLGKIPPEIALQSPDGDTIKLSSTRGNIVLLDFWASWCAPCRHESPNLVKAYKKYHSKGFQIYQVSLDKTRENWLQGIKEDHLGSWLHVSDLKFWQSSVVPLYQIEGIPTNFLLDRDGKIIDKNLRGQALTLKLSEIFGE